MYCSSACQAAAWPQRTKACLKAAAIQLLDINAFQYWNGKEGAALRSPPLIMLHDRLFSVKWNGLRRLWMALPTGIVRVEESASKTFVVTSPATVERVIDGILKTARGEPLDMEYEAGASDYVNDCSACPRVGFCGLVARGKGADGIPRYTVLWSSPFCHSASVRKWRKCSPPFRSSPLLMGSRRRLGAGRSRMWLQRSA